jgi:hypothetical protein
MTFEYVVNPDGIKNEYAAVDKAKGINVVYDARHQKVTYSDAKNSFILDVRSGGGENIFIVSALPDFYKYKPSLSEALTFLGFPYPRFESVSKFVDIVSKGASSVIAR